MVSFSCCANAKNSLSLVSSYSFRCVSHAPNSDENRFLSAEKSQRTQAMEYSALLSFGTTEILLATFVLVVSYLVLEHLTRKKKNLPPGPVGYPVIGCLPYIREKPYLRLQEMAKRYGDVFSMYLGTRLVVVLNGVDAIKEGMNKPEFLGRPAENAFDVGPREKSIIHLSGKPFHEQRKFMLHSMRDLGFGKTVMEELMKVELEYFLRAVEETKGQPYDIRTVLSPSMSNNITALVYGTRYDYEDPRRKLITETLSIVQEFVGQTAIHAFLPWISKVPLVKRMFDYKRAFDATTKATNFSRMQVEEHKKTLDPNHTRDYIDKFLIQMKNTKEKKLTDTSFTDEMLLGNVANLIGAGTETVNTTLNWCLLLMAVHQDVQKKIQDEIGSVIGSERMPAYVDQKQMPYTQSVIMEIMRHKTIIPLNVLRCTFEDTTFRGYDIPKHTIVLANLWSAHYDERCWKNPETFKSDRFLSADGKSSVKSEAYMPFSVGRRSCPGETMAVIEVFLYFTTILQRFNITLPEGVTPDLDGILTISYQPKPQNLCFCSRSSK